MKVNTTISRLLAAFMLLTQLLYPVAILAADGDPPVDSQTPPSATTTVTDPAPSSSPAAEAVTDSTASTPAPAPSTDTTAPSAPNPAPPTTGPQAATGADPASTGPQEPTGTIPDWVFNTATQRWEEADKSSFHWDAKSGYYLSPKYFYDTRIGWYEIIPASEPKPAYMITAPDAPKVVSTPIGDFVVGSPEYELAKSLGIIVEPSDPLIANSGPNSVNNASLTNSSTGLVDFTNIVRLANLIKSGATTGDANLSGNTDGGDAISGTARVMASVVNLLNSIWGVAANPVMTFIRNIFGDWNGDITIQAPTIADNPNTGGVAQTNTTGPNSVNNSALANNTDLKVNAQNSGTIDNNIDLNATSGAANVSGNTRGGSALSGDAQVTLNLINMINSAISSGGSFIGILNIYGNFNGDVLFSDSFLNRVLQPGTGGGTAGNVATGPESTNNANINNSSNTTANISDSSSINNNLSYDAASGSANVGGNTSAGSASSGSAQTHGTLFNLANQNIGGDNAVLVLVNVMGHWLGGIMNLSAGITSALLGSGNSVQNANTGPSSTNNSTVNNTANTDVMVNNEMAINNHVNLTAHSGDANVTGNTQAGNAATGKAEIASNVANITNSVINLKKWFGILIINVFGDWFGSLGRDTAAGNSPAPVVIAGQQQQVSTPSPSVHGGFANVFGGGGAAAGATQAAAAVAGQTPSTNSGIQVLAAKSASTLAAKAATKPGSLLIALAVGIMLLAGAMMSMERKLKTKQL